MPILSGQARVAGVLGWPIAHSRSPRLHGFWLERHGIDGAYLPLPVRPEEFERAVRGMVALGFAGANVTIPHKLAAFAICDELDDTARRAGAVNTLIFRQGRIIGRNTDGYGFIANLRGHGVDPAAGPALLLGAGGSTRAVAAALQDAGVPVSVVNRTRERADELAADLPGLRVLDWRDREGTLAEYALVVNTTALGMAGDDRLPVDLNRAARQTVVADIVYVPIETPLLAAARARGLRAVDGLGMLLHQARPGFIEWFGVEPEVDEALRQFVAADLIGK
jgi:shikimate dehydrogenase